MSFAIYGEANDMKLAATTPFGEVLFSGEKYPKAAGGTGVERLFQSQTPPFPRTPFGVRPAAVVFNDPPNLKAAACRFGALRAVPASHEQRYPPRLVSSCNSSAFSMPHKVFAPCSGLRSSGSAAQKAFLPEQRRLLFGAPPQPQPEKTVQISFFCDILLY